uniref:DUF6598 domain-containing protein n=1 Tax=Oryza rufipogon TaxID=4529 RepID=A0A0E0PQZ2_ORYRU
MEAADVRARESLFIPIDLNEKSSHEKQDEEEIHLRQLEQLLAPFNPWEAGDPELEEWQCARPKTRHPTPPPPPPRRCHLLFTMKLSVKRGQAMWSRKETPRFSAERAGGFPLRLARLAADGSPRLELEEDGGRVGALSCFESRPWPWSRREEVVALAAADSVPVRVVAVIRRFPVAGGDRLAIVSNMRMASLVVRLHDKLFVLPPDGSTVTIAFSERWFRVPSNWTEEKLYARVGHDFINITAALEDLARTLYQMYEQEEQKKMVLQEKQEQEKRKQEELNREREELEMMPLACIPLGHGEMQWESPCEAMHRRFKLSMGTDGEVRCNFVEQECPRVMRRRLACDGRFILPLTTMKLQVVGFVEGYSDPETIGFTEQRSYIETLRPVAMVSVLPQEHTQVDQILSFKFLVDNVPIRLNDGIILTGWSGITVGIHSGDDGDNCTFLPCTSAVSRELDTPNSRMEALPAKCRNDRKRRHDLGLSAIFALEAEEVQGLLYHQEQLENQDFRLNELSLSGEPSVGGEGEAEYSLLFESPGESDWVKVSEPYVPKFPTEEEIRKREEWRKEQLKLVMAPIIRPVQEPRRGINYFMSEPRSRSTREAEFPMHEPYSVLLYYWTLSDKSESKLKPKRKVYPRLVCLEWCTCSPSSMLQVYALEIIVADSLHSCKLDISGFVAIRDLRDGRRNYIFNREMDHPFTVVSQHGVLQLPTLSPRRAIHTNPKILLEFNLKMKRTGNGIHSYHDLIQGVVEHPSIYRRDWSRVNELSIVPCGNNSTPMMRLKLAVISKGVEATVELQLLRLPPGGIDLRCTARSGRIADDIELFDGKYGGDDTSLQFVVATELHGNMEIHLEAVCNGVSQRWCIDFVPKFHALFSQEASAKEKSAVFIVAKDLPKFTFLTLSARWCEDSSDVPAKLQSWIEL